MPKSFASGADGVETEAFQRYRPAFPRQLYRTVFEYHTDVGASWFSAWNPMAGEGFLAFELAKYFISTVHASDPSAAKIAQAVQYLSEQEHAKNRITFSVRRAEDGHPAPAQSLDAVAIGNGLHICDDPDKVVAAAANMLKANGTLAFWACGLRFFFLEPALAGGQAEAVFDAAFRKWMTASFKKSASQDVQVLASRLDSIELPEMSWENVKRIHWNAGHSMVGEPDSRVRTRPSKVGPGEMVERREEEGFMSVDADLDWIVNYMNTLNPKVVVEEVCGEELVQLAKELGGRNQKVKIGWPLTLVLATKR